MLTVEIKYFIKSALSSVRQFLSTESPLKMTKNAFYFNSNALFVLNPYLVAKKLMTSLITDDVSIFSL